MVFNVLVLNPAEIIFEGRARSVTLPGEQGVFEILPYHKPIISRIISGTMLVDEQAIPVLRGIVKFANNQATIIVE